MKEITKKILNRKFSTVTNVSNDMLISLSLSHFESQKFSSNDEMVDFLKEKNLISFESTQETMKKLDRRKFLEGKDEDVYSLKAHNFDKGVDVTNPMMQGILLDCISASINAIKSHNKQPNNFLDIGCATGYLTLGAQILADSRMKTTGIDIHEKSIEKAKKINESNFGFENCLFVVDDIFKHLNIFKKYDFIVSGCGFTHSDLIGTILSNLENDEDSVILAPIFTSNNQQSLKIHYPCEFEDSFVEEFSKIELFSQLNPQKLNDTTGFIELFTCFFTPLTYPNYESKKLKLNFESIGMENKDEDFKEKVENVNYRKLNLREIEVILNEKEKEFKKRFFELKRENDKVTLDDLNKIDDVKELLENINLLKRYQAAKKID